MFAPLGAQKLNKSKGNIVSRAYELMHFRTTKSKAQFKMGPEFEEEPAKEVLAIWLPSSTLAYQHTF